MVSFTAISGALVGIIPLIPMFIRDKENRLYSPTSFFTISSIHRLPFNLLGVYFYLFGSLIFLDIDLGDRWQKIPWYMLILTLTYFANNGLGDIISVLVQNLQLAN